MRLEPCINAMNMEAMVAYGQLSAPLALHHFLEAYHTVWDEGSTGHVLVERIWMVNIENCAVPENLCIKTDGEDDCCGDNGIFPAACYGGYEACYFAHQPH
ncbi:hypothetical protein L3X38_012582 [Prunus dulcis]|uniref:Uncharacterized protein n=1 Tax=Prunus dulcis TaxID=3755 RepID=A0AAD4WJL5_PRUDU|nr:hypothetical protein L3X38_012582 [Prunus dulcis]